MSATVLILVNGEQREIEAGRSVAELLKALDLPGERIAVERNKRIVRRAEWSDVVVEAGDSFEIVHFVGGG